MRKPIAIINNSHDEFVNFTYEFTNVCNYKCNYCWPESHLGTTRWPDFDKACDSFDHLISVYKGLGKKTVRVHLLGGEPTLWPRLGDFAKFIYDKHQCRVTMSTNGSRTLRWWEEYAEYFDDIQISVHHEFCDVEHIKKVMDAIYAKQSLVVAATVMMDPKAWDTCKAIVDEFVNYDAEWLVKVKLITDPAEKIVSGYVPEQLEYIKEKVKRVPPQAYIDKMIALNCIDGKINSTMYFDDGSQEPYSTFDLMANLWNKFTGWHCNLALDRLFIRYDGTIQGACGQRIGPYNLYSEDFKEAFTKDAVKPVICEQYVCDCPTEVKLTKYKDGFKQ